MIRIKQLKCGLRVVMDKIPYMQSVAVGIWVKTGCVNEDNSNHGISHFIEHMMFKGTSLRSARQIASDIDSLGAQINAFTSKESTCYYVKSLSSNVGKTCDILIDMLTDSLFDEVEMKKEKQVVKEEMKMVEDTPEDDVQDMLYEELYKSTPLANSILGTPESLDLITHDDIKNYIKEKYTLDHIVVSIAGNFDEDEICAQFEHKLSCMLPERIDGKPENAIYKPSFRTKVKDIEQSHICLGTKALKFADKDFYALTVLNNIIGGSMSSRLFQNIREDKGLAYTVYSYASSHDKEGFYAICAGVAHEKIEETVEAISYELQNLADKGVTGDELSISKEQTKGSYIFSLENTSNRMVSNGRFALLRNEVRTPEEIISAIDLISSDDIIRVARLITDFSQYSGTLVSRRDVDLASLIRK